jgi:hypothetical protein
MIKLLDRVHKRVLNHLQARAYQLLSFSAERLGQLAELRPQLIAAYRTACSRHDDYGKVRHPVLST